MVNTLAFSLSCSPHLCSCYECWKLSLIGPPRSSCHLGRRGPGGRPDWVAAQPLSSFHFNNLSDLASSLLLDRTHALRLRILGREIFRILRPSRCRSVVTFLDLSTFSLSDFDTGKFFCNLPRLHQFGDAHTRDRAAFAHHCMLTRKDRPQSRGTCEPPLGGASGPGRSRPRKTPFVPRGSALRTVAVGPSAHRRRRPTRAPY
ncbi:hypothetical protein EDB85DRAFT_333767 [Lactarius pseudohatsudake]|nr:hypothetical protein EDB85DRAFT_333767 [Lactarius pseudohatsudake]